MATNDEIIQLLKFQAQENEQVRQWQEYAKAHPDDKHAQLKSRHTGDLYVYDNDDDEVEFYWSGGNTLLMSEEFVSFSAKYIEWLSDDVVRVGCFILDIIERYPEYKILVARNRTLEMPE